MVQFLHALLSGAGCGCNPKTVWHVLRRRGWLSTGRRRIIWSGRRYDGRVQVSDPNRRWASDMTSIRAWDGRKGRLAIMIDCANCMVLAWRFAPRITADDLAEMLRETVFQRFGTLWIRAQRIEFLSTNVPEYTSHRFRPFVRAMGLIPCYTPPPQPGTEWLAGGALRQLQAGLCLSACLEMVEDVARQLLSWIEHDNQQAPHSALAMQSPVEFYAQGIVNTKQRPVQN